MRTMVGAIGFMLLLVGSGTASLVENTTGLCYQNDGQTTFDTKCDMPDAFADLQGLGADAPRCQTALSEGSAETVGTLVPPHEVAGAPQEDPSDFCVGTLYPTIPAGTRIVINLATADVETGFAVSLHLWDPSTGEELVSESAADAAPASGTDAAEPAAEPVSVHSGKLLRPYSPISVSAVLVDGVPQTSLGKSSQSVAVLDFLVKNEPHYMTVAGTQSILHAGDAVRLCDYKGPLSFSLGDGGGNIKFSGSAGSVQVVAGLASLESCQEEETIEPDLRCATDAETGRATQCEITVTQALPVVIFEARGHAIPPPKVGFAAAPKHCHDICNMFGMEFLPSDWGLQLFPEPEE